MRYLLTAFLLMFSTIAHAQGLWRLDQPLSKMSISIASDTSQRRADLSQFIWGNSTPQLPALTTTYDGGCCNGEMAPSYLGVTPSSSIWLAYQMENNVWARVWYGKFTGSTCLMIVNAGHAEGFFNAANLSNYLIAGVDALVRRLAGKPCDLILNSMPLYGENRFAASYLNISPDDPSAHDKMAAGFPPATGSAVKYFVGPGLAALSYALAQRSYQTIGAVGLSGGGWATTMMAAIDQRIQRSYAVAGSVPLDFRGVLPREGDWEQYALPFDYLDLYAMGADAANRKAFLFYNGKDPCCFSLLEAYPWASSLSAKLASFPGQFAAYEYFAATTHDIQVPVADFIMNDLAN